MFQLLLTLLFYYKLLTDGKIRSLTRHSYLLKISGSFEEIIVAVLPKWYCVFLDLIFDSQFFSNLSFSLCM